MATLTLRNQKGSPLTNTEVDGNFTALNADITSLNTSVGGITTTVTNSGISNFNTGTTAPTGTTRLNLEGYWYATRFYGDGSNLTGLNASNLASGVVGTARLGTGTADATTFLRGDGTWQTMTSYTLPAATASILGGVKIGSGVSVAVDGTISVPVTAIATTSVAGTVKGGGNIAIAGDGTISYSLPVATGSVLGGVKAGTGVTIAGDGTLTANPGTTITDDIVSATTCYPSFTSATSGTATTIYTSSTKLSYVPSTGTLNAVIFNTTSDIRRKTDIQYISNGLNIVSQLHGATYKFKDSGLASAGVIAQEIQTVLPDAVNTDADGMLSVNYNAIVPYLIEAIKELKAEIATLKGA